MEMSGFTHLNSVESSESETRRVSTICLKNVGGEGEGDNDGDSRRDRVQRCVEPVIIEADIDIEFSDGENVSVECSSQKLPKAFNSLRSKSIPQPERAENLEAVVLIRSPT